MAKILLLSLVFSPDIVSTANIMTDLAQELHNLGHDVTVLTSTPHYNPSDEVLQNPVYRPPFPRLFSDVVETGLRVIRVRMPQKRGRIWARLFDYLWFHTSTTLLAALKIRHQEVIFVPSPPITLGINGYLLALFLRSKMVYEVLELWPDVPVRMGLLQNKLLIRLAYGIEAFVYRKSVAITSIAHHFNQSLIERGVPKEKLYFTPVFVDTEWLKPGPKVNAFSARNALEDQYVVFYAGNIGLTQGLEILVDVAREFEDDPEVVFLIIGDGAGSVRFEQVLAQSGLENIYKLPFQPYEDIPQTYATADICVSPMRAGFSYDIIPSKILTCMAAGRPVVAASEPDTETAQLIGDSGGGMIVTPESVSELVAALRKLRNSPELAAELAAKGRQWVVDHYSKPVVIETYDQVIRQVAEH